MIIPLVIGDGSIPRNDDLWIQLGGVFGTFKSSHSSLDPLFVLLTVTSRRLLSPQGSLSPSHSSTLRFTAPSGSGIEFIYAGSRLDTNSRPTVCSLLYTTAAQNSYKMLQIPTVCFSSHQVPNLNQASARCVVGRST